MAHGAPKKLMRLFGWSLLGSLLLALYTALRWSLLGSLCLCQCQQSAVRLVAICVAAVVAAVVRAVGPFRRVRGQALLSLTPYVNHQALY